MTARGDAADRLGARNRRPQGNRWHGDGCVHMAPYPARVDRAEQAHIRQVSASPATVPSRDRRGRGSRANHCAFRRDRNRGTAFRTGGISAPPSDHRCRADQPVQDQGPHGRPARRAHGRPVGGLSYAGPIRSGLAGPGRAVRDVGHGAGSKESRRPAAARQGSLARPVRLIERAGERHRRKEKVLGMAASGRLGAIAIACSRDHPCQLNDPMADRSVLTLGHWQTPRRRGAAPLPPLWEFEDRS